MATPTVASAALLFGLCLISDPTRAADQAPLYATDVRLQQYEPITAGVTKDNDDVVYEDVTLSFKYRVLPLSWTRPNDRVFVAFTGRFGFYLGTRDSSPVIGKSYNPKFLWRHVLADTGNLNGADSPQAGEDPQFLDFAYAHQSDGQSIDTPAEYLQARTSAQRPEFANDFISRGWDYLEVAWKKRYGAGMRWSSYLDLRYFLTTGLWQGKAEEYNTWENNPQGKPRRAVDGLTGVIRHDWPSSHTALGFGRPSVSLEYQTGYRAPFKYSTVRAEAGIEFFELPLVFWTQSGYMSDLAMYYRKVISYGIELRIEEH